MSDLPTQLREQARYAADGPPSPMVADMIRLMREAADRLEDAHGIIRGLQDVLAGRFKPLDEIRAALVEREPQEPR